MYSHEILFENPLALNLRPQPIERFRWLAENHCGLTAGQANILYCLDFLARSGIRVAPHVFPLWGWNEIGMLIHHHHNLFQYTNHKTQTQKNIFAKKIEFSQKGGQNEQY